MTVKRKVFKRKNESYYITLLLYVLFGVIYVAVAANIPQAASTALPPLLKMVAPAVAPIGLPVIANQFLA